MRKITAIFVLFAIMLQLSGRLMIFLGYEVNQQYIAKTLCVNRTMPMMHCHGKCHLAKELQKEEKKEKSPLNGGKEKLEFASDHLLLSAMLFPSPAKTYSTYYPLQKVRDTDFSVFHPPLA